MAWIILAALGATPVFSPAGRDTAGITGTAAAAASENFLVTSYHPAHNAREIAAQCESWRARLLRFCSAEHLPVWSPRCAVIVHANCGSYLAAVGAGGAQTYGSSLIRHRTAGQPASWRIDFRGDSPHGLAAVPHELMHIVLADCLGRPAPRWADEGLAILADAQQKQLLHHRDLARGLADRSAFRLADLVLLESYPPAWRVPAFYGQSASLTAFLLARGEPETFIDFLQQALEQGYDQALRDCYQIEGLGALERLWYAEQSRGQAGLAQIGLAHEHAAITRQAATP